MKGPQKKLQRGKGTKEWRRERSEAKEVWELYSKNSSKYNHP